MKTAKLPEATEAKKAEAAEAKKPELRLPERRKYPVPFHIRSKDRLTITPKAWAKIMYMRDRGESEISGFGISDADDPLRIIDFKLIEQVNRATFTEFVDKALADYVTDMCIAGIPPARAFRVWIHTHPKMGVTPSGHDASTFARTTEMSNWGVMCIVSDKDASARLVTNVDGLSGEKQLKVEVEFNCVFEGVTEADYQAWEDEYCACVRFESAGGIGTSYGGWERCREDQRGASGDSCRASYDEDSLFGLDEFDLDVNGELVQWIEEGGDGYAYVYTDNWWFQYGNIKEIVCDLGDTLKDLGSLSFHVPYEYGRCEWNGQQPIRIVGYPDEDDKKDEQEKHDDPDADGDNDEELGQFDQFGLGDTGS